MKFSRKTQTRQFVLLLAYTFHATPSILKTKKEPKPLFICGRRGEIRTPDILLPKQARYQATLHAEGRHYTENPPRSQYLAHQFTRKLPKIS